MSIFLTYFFFHTYFSHFYSMFPTFFLIRREEQRNFKNFHQSENLFSSCIESHSCGPARDNESADRYVLHCIMLNCIVCTALYYTEFYCLYCIAVNCTAWTVLNSITSTVLYCLYCTTLNCTACTVLNCITSTVPYRTVLYREAPSATDLVIHYITDFDMKFYSITL